MAIALPLSDKLNTDRVLPLTQTGECDKESSKELEKSSPESLFPSARSPQVAFSALLLLFGCWKESHDLIDEDESPDGCYLHAIVHRIEPNPGNSDYWFRRIPNHPVFEKVLQRAKAILEADPAAGWELKSKWDPFLFNRWCEEARRSPGTQKERVAVAIQQAEWELLYGWCSSPV